MACSKFKKFGSVLALLTVAALPSQANAQAAICAGAVTLTGVETTGYFRAAFGFGYSVICNIKGDYTVNAGAYGSQTISLTQCQALVSQFMTPASRGKSASAYIANGVCPDPNNPDLSSNYPMAWLFYN